MSLGERIKQARIKKGLSQTELGEKCGVTPSMISFIESGEKIPSVAVLKIMAIELDTTADYLLGIER